MCVLYSNFYGKCVWRPWLCPDTLGSYCAPQISSHPLLGSGFDRNKQVDVAVLEFSKAFDVVPHQRLLGKLRHCGIDGLTLAWIESFLSGRSQRVIVDGVCSSWSPVLSGVPQGTVLGPLLFLIYINDLHDCVMSRVRLFADDCLIYREIHNLEDQLALQKDLDILEQWANKWGMQFNPAKCNILSISRSTLLHRFCSLCGTVGLLQNVDEARYLGINLSKDLQWGNHIQSIVAKSSSSLGSFEEKSEICQMSSEITRTSLHFAHQIKTGILCCSLGSVPD